MSIDIYTIKYIFTFLSLEQQWELTNQEQWPMKWDI